MEMEEGGALAKGEVGAEAGVLEGLASAPGSELSQWAARGSVRWPWLCPGW